MYGIISIVRILSAFLFIVLVAIIAGTLHPKPIKSGMNELPCRPIRCMYLSIMVAALGRYSVSDNNDRKKKRIKIFGRNASTLPTPMITPLEMKSLIQPVCILLWTNAAALSISHSIPSCGIAPSLKVQKNMNQIINIKIARPHTG
ncbi:hypothetical protein SDC9_116108 [bioreactor metagenome]|uniref:Uncharacterized protein n=1 Tax=bioreactor metagenome TaxID=1076179 RepID=A0A645C5D8_9ZZZZ